MPTKKDHKTKAHVGTHFHSVRTRQVNHKGNLYHTYKNLTEFDQKFAVASSLIRRECEYAGYVVLLRTFFLLQVT